MKLKELAKITGWKWYDLLITWAHPFLKSSDNISEWINGDEVVNLVSWEITDYDSGKHLGWINPEYSFPHWWCDMVSYLVLQKGAVGWERVEGFGDEEIPGAFYTEPAGISEKFWAYVAINDEGDLITDVKWGEWTGYLEKLKNK
jgi:hypothetical protein